MNIACIAQNTQNGNLYVGTGESFANVNGIDGTPGFLGSGLYESTDGGITWSIFHNAKPTGTNQTTLEWAFVNRIAVDPSNGRVYAATNKGLRYWDDATSTWINPIYMSNGTTLNVANSNCVVVGSDRTVAVAIGNRIYVSPGVTGNGEPHSFVDNTPISGGRTELAISPSNPDYIYACIAKSTGALQGVYRSTDKGVNWTVIGPGGSTAFQLFGPNGQGTYDNCIAVDPANPDRIFVGGLVIWEWHLGSSFAQVTVGSELIDSHVDMHAIVFDLNHPNTFYLGSDGGVAKTSNSGQTFMAINKNYNVTQFYAVAINGSTGVMGGTQDNSNPYVSGTGLDPKKGKVLFGGDGGWSAFSLINTDAFFGTMQYAGFWRSPDKGVTYQSATDGNFVSGTMKGTATPGTTATYAPFVTPLVLWESFNDLHSPLGTWFVDDSLAHNVGDVITVHSQNNRYPFQHVITAAEGNLGIGDSLLVQDIITSKFFVGLNNGIWMTFGPLQFQGTPQWFQIANITDPHTLTISKDGNYMFVGTTGGALYRISNILAISDSLSAWYNSPFSVVETAQIGSFSQAVTSVAIDPNNNDRILVTFGNYGNTSYVSYCANALDQAPTFTSKQGTTTGSKLPAMPVYSAIFEMGHPNMVILGTEYGVYATEDITKTAAQIVWTEENSGMARVPVFMIRQQIYNYPGVTNYGGIYIGTHGKGFYWNNQYLGVNDNQSDKATNDSKLLIYPNPVNDIVNIGYALTQKSSVTIKIYDLNGKVVKMVNKLNMLNGYHTEAINCTDLSKGTYIVQLLEGNNSLTSKIIVTK
ncbi:MAG: T9SS type A sorting domain-containing protein, partial [Bacteroidota bacterium]